ncbi:MAG TPA: (2Fe-2S)-binding protein [Holophaga sp.]|nr:(2Fe-2S)-binding protein [Holophaga sp.]HPS66629.1 (2Fe-2S)-binding protein [Holophaga sp.]
MKPLHEIRFTLNGEPREFLVSPDDKLLEVLRREGLTGAKHGCGTGSCGACTVILDGRAVYACLLYAFQAEGRSVETIEGIGGFDHPHPIQKALVEGGAVQCGFCTPGMVLSAKALLAGNPHPSDEELKVHMDGNLCRCTGYEKIEAALRRVIAAGGAR